MGIITALRWPRFVRRLIPNDSSEARFRSLVEGSIQGIYVHDTKKVVFANQACANIFGYDSPSELYQLDTVFRLNAPHEIEWMRELGAARQRGEPVKSEYIFDGQRRDGSFVRLHMMARPVIWEGISCNQCVVVDVSARQHAEEALKRSEQRFRRLFEAAPVALWEQDWSQIKIIIDRLADDGIDNADDLRAHLLASPALLEELMAGRVQIDVNTETLAIFRADTNDKARFIRWAQQVDFGDLSRVLVERVVRLASGERRVTIEGDEQRMDGEVFAARVTTEIVVESDWSLVYTTLVDITEERAAATRIRASEERLRDILEVISDRIWEVNEEFRFTFVSAHGRQGDWLDFSQILGRVGNEMLKQGLFSVVSEDDNLAYKTALREQQPFYNVLHRADTSQGEYYFEASGTPRFDATGQFAGYRGAMRDITARYHAEQALQRSYLELEDKVAARTHDLALANEQLQELDRLKSMFIASMSHELRTPLNAIIGFTGVILQGMTGELNATQSDQLSRVYAAAKHLLALISDVIDISKIEAGMTDVFPEDVDVEEVAREVLETLKTQIEAKDLSVRIKSAPLQIVTDRRRLLQCMLNLVSNAVKYTERGTVTIVLRITDGYLEVEVADTGIGIAQSQLSKLFQPFERLDSHLLIGTPGTGLGLYLTRKLVKDVLQGEINVRSEHGKGSVFTLRLPERIEASSVQQAEPPK